LGPVDYGLYLELVTVSHEARRVIPREHACLGASRSPHMAARGTVQSSQH